MSTLHNTHVPKPHKTCTRALPALSTVHRVHTKKCNGKTLSPLFPCLPSHACWNMLRSRDAGAPHRNEVVVTAPNISATFSRAKNSLFNVTSGEKSFTFQNHTGKYLNHQYTLMEALCSPTVFRIFSSTLSYSWTIIRTTFAKTNERSAFCYEQSVEINHVRDKHGHHLWLMPAWWDWWEWEVKGHKTAFFLTQSAFIQVYICIGRLNRI